MKSYTSIEQAKKLAEFLPLESADMWFHPYPNDEYWYDVPNIGNADLKYNQLPCWSLAALLDVLPPYLFEFKRGIDLNVYPNLNGKGWHCSYMPNYIENIEKDKFKLITSEDSLVDACYEMIIKLHELNLF